MSEEVPAEKSCCPIAVIRVDPQRFNPTEPWGAVTVVSLFDDKARAMADVERLNALRALDSNSLYFVQQVKKYFRDEEPAE